MEVSTADVKASPYAPVRAMGSHRIPRTARLLTAISLIVLTSMHSSCSGGPRTANDEIITVEGNVSVRGNHPFTRVLLETRDDTQYVLEIDRRSAPGFHTPSYARVSGRVYAGEWDGRPFAHIDVTEWEIVDGPEEKQR